MPTSTDEPDNSAKRRPSRLEAEVEEILARAEADQPLPPPTPFRKPRRPRNPDGPPVQRLRGSPIGATIERWVSAAPLFVALALAILAYLLRDLSPLLTRLIVIAAMVALFWPFFARWRRPGATSTQMWRGREIRFDQTGPSPLDELRRWFRNRR